MMLLRDQSNSDNDPMQGAIHIDGFVNIFRDRTKEHNSAMRMARLQIARRLQCVGRAPLECMTMI